MDVDEEQYDLMKLFEGSFPWRSPKAQQIEARRALMSDVLIFDILLSSGGIKHPDALYPPTDVSTLRKLLDAIEESTYDTLKKDCLIYFLLKWYQDGREERFANERCIPPQFIALADAYWNLDAGVDVPRAVSLLSDARLNRDYTSKILQAISLTDNPNPLILRYVRTAKPLLTEPDDLDTYVVALVSSSLMEAWQFQRTFPEGSDTRARLIRKILFCCLAPKPRSKPLTQLLAFPINNHEQSIIHAYALRPPADLPTSSIPVIQDLVCVRLIQSGQYAAAIKLDRQLAAISVRGGEARKVAQERKQVMDELMAAMPAAERQLLELELEQMAQGGDLSASSTAPGMMSTSGDLSMSWEHIRTPSASVAKPSSRIQPALETSIPSISQKSGAPRFGGRIPAPTFGAIGTSSRSNQEFPLPASQFQQNLSLSAAVAPPVATAVPPPQASSSSAQWLPGPAQSISASRGEKPPGSLYETVGSANLVRNAFYNPPISAGSKRPFGESASQATAAPTRVAGTSGVFTAAAHESISDHERDQYAEQEDKQGEDTEMHIVGDEDQPSAKGRTDVSRSKQPQLGLDNGQAEFSVSVFGSAAGSTKSQTSRAETGTKRPPGAFMSDSEDESEPEPEHVPRKESRRETTQYSLRTRAEPARPTRTSRNSTQNTSSGRSLPGSLVDPEEEEDVVPPLPPPTPARRQQRKLRASKSVGEVYQEPLRPRRSSRLSVVSSPGSSSPEPASPEKMSAATRSRRSGRTSATAAVLTTPAKATRSKTRR